MTKKSKSSNKGSDNSLLASLLHERERKLFGGTSGGQDLGDSSVVQQNQEFSINSEEFPSLPKRSEASPGMGNRNAVRGLSAPQNLENATSGSNLATNSRPGYPSVQGQNQLSSSALQKGSSSGGPSSQSHVPTVYSPTNRGRGNLNVQGKDQPSSSVLQQGSSSGGPSSQSRVPTVNSPNSKGWFYDVSSNTRFLGDLRDYFPSADPPDAFQRLQEQQEHLQRESSSSHQQGQQQVLAVSTGGTSSSVNNQDLVRNTKGVGSSIPGVLHTSVTSDYCSALVQGLGVSQNAGPQITSSETGGNITRSISSDGQEQNQLASGVLQQGSSARGPISQSQVQAVNSPNPNDSFLPNLGDDVTSASSPEGVRRHNEQPGLEETSDVQQHQKSNIQDENLPGFAGNADNSTNLRGKEKVQDNTMPTIPPQHTPMSRTVGFSSGESSSSHRPQTNAGPAVGSSFEQVINWLHDYAVRGLQTRVYAEAELYNRGWVYHNSLKSWLKKDPDVPLSEKTQTHEKGSYICFDPASQRYDRKDDFVVEYKMLKERPRLP